MQFAENHICDGTCCKENSANHLRTFTEKMLTENEERKPVLLPINMQNKDSVPSALNGSFEKSKQFKTQLKHKKKKKCSYQEAHNVKQDANEMGIKGNSTELFENEQINEESFLKPCYVMLNNLDIRLSSAYLKHVESDVIANIMEERSEKDIKQDLYSKSMTLNSNQLVGSLKEEVGKSEDKQNPANLAVCNSQKLHKMSNFRCDSAEDFPSLKSCTVVLTKLNMHIKRHAEDSSDDNITAKRYKGEEQKVRSKYRQKAINLKHMTNSKKHTSNNFLISAVEKKIVKHCSVVLPKLDISISDISTIQHPISYNKEKLGATKLRPDFVKMDKNCSKIFSHTDFDTSESDNELEIENFYKKHYVKKTNMKKCENDCMESYMRRSSRRKYFTESSEYSDSSSVEEVRDEILRNSVVDSKCDFEKTIKPCFVLLSKSGTGVDFNLEHPETKLQEFYKEQDDVESSGLNSNSSFITVNGTSSYFDWQKLSDTDLEDNEKAKSPEEKENQYSDIDASSNYSGSTIIMHGLKDFNEKESCEHFDENVFQCSTVKKQCNIQDCVSDLKPCFVSLKRIDETDFVSRKLSAENTSVFSPIHPEDCDLNQNVDLSTQKCNNDASAELNHMNDISQPIFCRQLGLKMKNWIESANDHTDIHLLQNEGINQTCTAKTNHMENDDYVHIVRDDADIKSENDSSNGASYVEMCEGEKSNSGTFKDTGDLYCDQDTLEYDSWYTDCIKNTCTDYTLKTSDVCSEGEIKSDSEDSSATVYNLYQDNPYSFADLQKSTEIAIKIEKPETDLRSNFSNYKPISLTEDLQDSNKNDLERDKSDSDMRSDFSEYKPDSLTDLQRSNTDVHKTEERNADFRSDSNKTGVPETSVNSIILGHKSFNETINSDVIDFSSKPTFRSKCGKEYIVEYFEYENIKKLFITVNLGTYTKLKDEAECDKSKLVSCENEKLSKLCSHCKKILLNDQHILHTEVGNTCFESGEQNSHLLKSEISDMHDTGSDNSGSSNELQKVRNKKTKTSTSHDPFSINVDDSSNLINDRTFVIVSDASDDPIDSGSEHSGVSNHGGSYCIQCMSKFSDRYEYCSHVCLGKREKGYLCEYCEKIFSSYTDVKIHTELHKN